MSIKSIISEFAQNRLNEKTKLVLVYLFSVSFIIINSYLITKEYFWGIFIPLFIVTAFLYIFAYDKQKDILYLIDFSMETA